MESATLLTDKEKQVLASQREIDWLRRQIEHHQMALGPDPPESENTTTAMQTENDTMPELCNTIDRLRTELDVMTQFNLSRTSLTRNLDAQYYILDALTAGPSDHDSMERRRQLKAKLQERDELTVLVMRAVDQLRKARLELTKSQTKLIDTQQSNRRLIDTIQNMRAASLEQANQETTSQVRPEAMHDMFNRLEIARNVLMGLILESNIDWADDERWLEVMLKISDPVEDV